MDARIMGSIEDNSRSAAGSGLEEWARRITNARDGLRGIVFNEIPRAAAIS
jgi:hypothetical protein